MEGREPQRKGKGARGVGAVRNMIGKSVGNCVRGKAMGNGERVVNGRRELLNPLAIFQQLKHWASGDWRVKTSSSGKTEAVG
jgi:hypothetical protein